MRTAVLTVGLMASLFAGHPSRGEDKASTLNLPALQEALEETIAETEVSIACILVSRSTEYERWRAAPPAPAQGKLGRFDGELARRLIQRDNEAERKVINAIDLAHPDHTPESYGSGIVIDATGLVLTNAHVVRNATKVYVRLPGGKGSYADVHASDPRSDLAVLRLLDPPEDLKPIKFGDGDKLRKGQFVLLLANPFAAGFRDGSPSASWGMISNLRRRTPGPRYELDPERQTLHHYGTLVQVDTRINLGCSGGALLNIKGELIGITTAMAALTGTETPGGFAVPMDGGMRRIIEVLKRGEEVEYGFLGVRLHTESANTPKKGVGIAEVEDGSPAQRAGLLGGDTIVGINGTPARENDDLFLLIGNHLAASTIRLEVLNRLGQKRVVPVKLAKYYVAGPIIAANRPPARFGLRVDYTSILSQRVHLPRWMRGLPEGVMIREVVPDSPAEKAQLQPDKIITRVNTRAVTTPAEFYQEMEKASRAVDLTVLDSEGREERIRLEGK